MCELTSWLALFRAPLRCCLCVQDEQLAPDAEGQADEATTTHLARTISPQVKASTICTAV